MGCSCARLVCVFAILLLLAGGGAVGAYLAIRNRGNLNDANFENGDEASSEETAKLVGDNKDIVSKNIERFNNFYGLSYSPFGLGDNRLCPPFDDVGYKCLLSDQVIADVRLISTMTNRIKTYSLICEIAMDKMLTYCGEHGIKVMLGVWVSKNSKANDAELERLERILAKHAKSGVITDIMLGNEAVFIVGAKIKDLASSAEKVREILAANGASNVKIGSAEIYNVWVGEETEQIEGDDKSVKDGLDMTAVVEQLDWIGLNTHPYYGGVDPSTGNAGKYVLDEARAVEKFWSAKSLKRPVYITETGFPSDGEARSTSAGTATPSVKGLEQFCEQIEDVSRDNALPVYFFEPFNGDWKRRWEQYTVADYNWGLHTCDRVLKDIELPADGAL